MASKSFSEIIQKHIDKFANMMYTVSIARIVEVNIEEEKIVSLDVKPQVQTKYSDGLSNSRPTIYNVPPLFPSSSEGIMSFPLKVGDPVLLAFCKEDIQEWLEQGEEIPATTARQFSQTDAVAIPCLFPFKDSPGVHSENMVLRFHETYFEITPEGDFNTYCEGNFKLACKGGVSISNDSVELIQFLEDLSDELSKTTVTIEKDSIESTGSPGTVLGPTEDLTIEIDNKANIETLRDLIKQLKPSEE